MKKIPRPLLVLHGDRVFRERLKVVAASRGFEFRLIADWDALLEELRAAPASALVVVDPYLGVQDQQQPSVELAALLNRFPSLAITAAMAAGPGRLEHVRRLGEWGVVQIIDLDEEATVFAIAQRLLSARGRPLRNLIERALPPSASGAARAILAAATSVVSQGGTGVDLARSLHVTPRTLTRWCRRAGLPPPRRLLAWMRVLLAAELLDDTGRTVTDVALSCGYAADSSLRHAMRSFLNMVPTQLRERGAFEVASRVFLRALAEAKSANARYRAPRVE
jgi:AraC-like DNA-binding protein